MTNQNHMFYHKLIENERLRLSIYLMELEMSILVFGLVCIMMGFRLGTRWRNRLVCVSKNGT